MKSLLGRKLADSVSSVGSMILFLLFASCSLIIIAAGASTYARISDSFSETFSSSAAARYVTNKIRSGESSLISEDGRTIAVYSGGTVCVIASGSEGITEVTLRADDEIGSDMGDVIFPGASLRVSDEENGLYSVTVGSSEKSITVYCRNKG